MTAESAGSVPSQKEASADDPDESSPRLASADSTEGLTESTKSETGPSTWMPSVIRVPEDCVTVGEALKRAIFGQTVIIAAGEYSWNGRIVIEKVVHIQGEKDPQNGSPLTVLKGRWRLCVPPPVKWDLDPKTTGSFTDVRCQAEGGYCVQITGMHWEMVNSRFLCSGGTAMFVSSGHVTLDRCWVGGVKDDMISNNGLVISNEAKVMTVHSTIRNSKIGASLREAGSLFFMKSEIHRVAIAFGCELPNECDMEVAESRLHDLEVTWHEGSRPARLVQKGNYDIYGNALFLHGAEDGCHTFQTQDLKSTRL